MDRFRDDDEEAAKRLTARKLLLLRVLGLMGGLALLVAFTVYAVNYHSPLTGFEGCARVESTHVRLKTGAGTSSGPRRSTVITFAYGEEYCDIEVDVLPASGVKIGDRLVIRGVHSRKICTVSDVIGPCAGEAAR